MAGPSLTVPAGLTLAETRALSRKFSVRMAQAAGEAIVYWLPARRDVVIRSASLSNVEPPADGLVVGCYRPPYPSALFLADLSATIQEASVRERTSVRQDTQEAA
jgi:hypothetical protein